MSLNSGGREPMLEIFLFESSQQLEQLEELALECEKMGKLPTETINEIFRIMHTIKGSAAMMMFSEISSVAHSLEDVFFFIRENKTLKFDYSELFEVVLAGVDFIKVELVKIDNGDSADGMAEQVILKIRSYLTRIKNSCGIQCLNCVEDENTDTRQNDFFYISTYQKPANISARKYEAVIFFDEECRMENIRAYTVVHNLKEEVTELFHLPADIIDNEAAVETIQKDGFRLFFSSVRAREELEEILNQTLFISSVELKEVDQFSISLSHELNTAPDAKDFEASRYDSGNDLRVSGSMQQNIISVNISKLDMLMDLVGEIVITEAMVTGNPDLEGLQLDNFNKTARQLRKLTDELQDIVMSVRMIPVSMTFHKMNRIVRDMSKKMDKSVELELIGEETEVDKNIIDTLSDPLMHLIRNAVDHGIEPRSERLSRGKPETGKIVLEARNSGGDVWIVVKDDGKGLDRERILHKAREQGLLGKPENELSDKDIYSMILLPGFSTKDTVTEFSGRGVGMDVVKRNLEKVGGSIVVDSVQGMGTTISVKIPLTLAIIDGMEISVGRSIYTIPTGSITESFRVDAKDVIRDPDGNEMIIFRGTCLPVIRLHRHFNVKTGVQELHEGIIVVVESSGKAVCLFADSLIGEQQVVVKPLPPYISRTMQKKSGIGGCTILGDGSISLIMDIGALIE